MARSSQLIKGMISSFRWRVKVYALDDEATWRDKGTGHLTAEINDVRDVVLVVRSDDDGTGLLDSKVQLEENKYSVQQDTLVLWKEADGAEFALSFEGKEGCDDLLDLLKRLQKLNKLKKSNEQAEDDLDSPLLSPDISEDVTLEESSSDSEGFPEPKVGQLAELATALKNVHTTLQKRVASYLLKKNYARRLADLFVKLESAGDLERLQQLCTIFKAMFDLGEASIVEEICEEGILTEVIGALEYEPGTDRLNHREFLSRQSKFVEVIQIRDNALLQRIHTSYQLGFLRDAVLGCVPDDPVSNTISTCINSYNTEVVRCLLADNKFLKQLFGELLGKKPCERATGERATRLLGLVQSLCELICSMPSSHRKEIMETLMEYGLLDPLAAYLEDPRHTASAIEILNVIITNDCSLVQEQIIRDHKGKESGIKNSRLLEAITTVLLESKDISAVSMLTELVKAVMVIDSEACSASRRSLIARGLWEGCITRLIASLSTLEDSATKHNMLQCERMHHLVDCVAAFMKDFARAAVIRAGVLSSGVLPKVAKHINSREKHLALAALRLVHAVAATEDETYAQHLRQHDCLGPVVTVLAQNASRHNMLYSAAYTLLDLIKVKNNKSLVAHVVEMHGKRLAPLLPDFNVWVERHQTNMLSAAAKSSKSAASGSKPGRVRGRLWQPTDTSSKTDAADDWLAEQAQSGTDQSTPAGARKTKTQPSEKEDKENHFVTSSPASRKRPAPDSDSDEEDQKPPSKPMSKGTITTVGRSPRGLSIKFKRVRLEELPGTEGENDTDPDTPSKLKPGKQREDMEEEREKEPRSPLSGKSNRQQQQRESVVQESTGPSSPLRRSVRRQQETATVM